MLAKILVGVMAAIAVTGVGIYYAMPDYSQPSCQKHTGGESLTTSEGDSCCAVTAACPTTALASTEPSGCCAAKTSCCEAAASDGLAACIGGMPTSAPVAKAKAKVTCCDE